MSGASQKPGASLTSGFTSTTGGVMTVEAGAITGDLELLTRPTGNDDGIEALVGYTGARDQYTVAGSPVTSTSPHQDTHDRILERLTTPGTTGAAGELPVDLTELGEQENRRLGCDGPGTTS